MKKGLLITLVVAVALLSSTGFSYAPVLKNIPDIIIGDLGPNSTIDTNANNFFVFSNAFVFDSYVTDVDTTPDLLKWSFAKTGQTPATPAETIVINNLDVETADLTFLNPTHNIRTGNPAATFRNDTLSPRSGTIPYPAPSADQLLVNVHLALYVSDGINKDSQEITVYSMDNHQDGYSGMGIDPSYTQSFDTQGQWVQWDGVSGVAPASYGSYDAGNKRIVVNFPVYPFGGAGWTEWFEWNSGHTGFNTPIVYAADTIFAIKARLSADANTSVPQLRLRAQCSNGAWTACLVAGATLDNSVPGGQGGAPQTTPADFFVMFEPQGSTNNIFFCIDAYSGLSYLGAIYVDDFKAYRIPKASVTLTPEATVSSFTGWGVQNTGVTVASSTITLGLIDASAGWHDAGQFITLANPLTAGKAYKVTYRLNKSGSTSNDQIRLRVGDANNAAYSSNFVISGAITTTASPYYAYHVAANGRAVGTGDLAIFIDGIRTVGDTAASTVLNTPMTIESFVIPQLN
jgi:hypothetical protein